ncbi:MAG TPA: Ig-like domain-containing protein, partial [Methylomirabilota bacterium]|nr:Ig-like domain-containing protein [Methylomirabilota bacterium]
RRAGRQTQGTRLRLGLGSALAGVTALALACANLGDPPGGPPDSAPPVLLAVSPESGAVVPDWDGPVVLQFDEVIDEMAGGGGGGGGAGGAPALTGLARQVVLSPVAGEVKASWHRSSIHVKPAEGWKPNRVYRLELLPGVVDLRRNATKQGALIIFSTGPALPHATLTGSVLAWVEQRVLAQAVIRAAPLPDTVAYVTLADSAGDFRLSDIPPGRYLVWAIQDQNSNRRLDRREAFDTTTVAVDSTAGAVLWTFVHDTAGPRVQAVEPVDSVAFRVGFSQPLDPRRPLDTARVRVYALPDTTPVGVRALFTPAQYDSIQARARAAADSLRRAADTTA